MSEANDDVEVILVDDHPIYREGLAALLASIPGFRVVATASDGDEALEVLAQTDADVVVMDVNMPRMDGIEATRRIAAEHPHIGVVVLTMSEGDDTVFRAMRAGARGYLVKGASQQDIARAIRSVAGGDVIFGPSLAAKVADFFSRGAAADVYAFPQLTSREREILDLVAAGRTNPQIAETLYLAPKTVRNNVANIFVKLQVSSRTEAVIKAREAGLG